jgi:AbrB family looped-hinge helix DNA binding protein
MAFFWYFLTMRTTIDRAGRIVVPKRLRDELGLQGGEELEVSVRDGRLEIERPPIGIRLTKRGRGLVAVPDEQQPVLTAEAVRDVLDQVRR